jgi:hypothetical protein
MGPTQFAQKMFKLLWISQGSRTDHFHKSVHETYTQVSDDETVGIPSRGRNFFLFTITSRLALGPTQVSYQMSAGLLSPGIEQPGCKADHLSPTNASIKNTRTYTFTVPYNLMAWCLIKHRIHLHSMVLS